MNPFYLFNCFKSCLSVFILKDVLSFFLFEFDQDGLIEYHFISREEGADESAAGIEYLRDEGVPWQF